MNSSLRASGGKRVRLEGTVGGGVPNAGITVVELLITMAIMVIVLAAIGGLLTSSTRAYTVTAERSEALQDSEAVLQLMRYEIAMAGYRGLEEHNFDRPFSGGATETLNVRRGADGDTLTIRYFEDRYITGSDTGERLVTFRVDPAIDTLVREERRPGGGGAGTVVTELLVGNIASMEVLDVVDRFRYQVTIGTILADPDAKPEQMAGLNIRVTFVDGLEWEFLVGVSNPQIYSVTTL